MLLIRSPLYIKYNQHPKYTKINYGPGRYAPELGLLLFYGLMVVRLNFRTSPF
jgi:hypothetical protein